MDLAYLLAPFVGWVVAGSLKFAVNTIRSGRIALDQIGYGGLPSTHTTVVSTTAALVGLREGIAHPAFGVALTLAFIVVIDAVDLRRRLEGHARALNLLAGGRAGVPALRERLGHRPAEVLAGVLVGTVCAMILARIF